MKKIMALILCLFFVFLLFVGCKNIDPSEAIVGEWKYTALSMAGITGEFRDQLRGFRLNIFEDNTLICTIPPDLFGEGTYTLSEPKFGYMAIYIAWADGSNETFFFDSSNDLLLTEYDGIKYERVTD